MVKEIGLYNLEPKIVNSALMQIAQYHEEKGDNLYYYDKEFHDFYDKIYAVSLFTFTPKDTITKDMIKGGTGFNITGKLPEKIAQCNYYWSIYPECNFSLIWFSRGCIRKCPFCIVREKEGYIYSVKPKNLNPRGEYIKVMDNNFFANPNWKQAVNQLVEWKQKVDFQGIDLRLLTKEHCEGLNKLKHMKQIKIAWDLPQYDLRSKLKEIVTWIKPYKIMCYVLTGFNSTPLQDFERVMFLRSLKIDPFVMVFRDYTDLDHTRKPFNISFARWVNNKMLFKSSTWNEFYNAYKTKRFENLLEGYEYKT